MGSFSILNNISGIYAQNQLNLNNVTLSRTLQRLSSGKRINSGADDAAGLQIADALKGNVTALDQAVRNANDGISVLQIADGALQQITDLLDRGVTLAEEAATGTVDSTGRSSLEAEFRSVESEINRIASQSNFNGLSLFNLGSGFAGQLEIAVGDLGNAGASISVNMGYITVTGTTGVADINGVANTDLLNVHLDTATNAITALQYIKNALNAVAGMRSGIGSGINRLQAAVSVIQTQSQNTLAAESTIRDANIAAEVANLTKCQILTQTGMAALGQANSNGQLVLNLLKSV